MQQDSISAFALNVGKVHIALVANYCWARSKAHLSSLRYYCAMKSDEITVKVVEPEKFIFDPVTGEMIFPPWQIQEMTKEELLEMYPMSKLPPEAD